MEETIPRHPKVEPQRQRRPQKPRPRNRQLHHHETRVGAEEGQLKQLRQPKRQQEEEEEEEEEHLGA